MRVVKVERMRKRAIDEGSRRRRVGPLVPHNGATAVRKSKFFNR